MTETDRVAQLADGVAEAALTVPGVLRLHTGTYGEVATYLPGRRVEGVRLNADSTDVHVVMTSGWPLIDTALALRRAVEPLVTTSVNVFVEDVV